MAGLLRAAEHHLESRNELWKRRRLVMDDSMVRSRLQSALAWVQDNLDHFDPRRSPVENPMAGDQRVAELAVALYCCNSFLDADFDEPMHRITGLLRQIDARGDFFDRLIRSPSGLGALLYVFAALRARGEDVHHRQQVLQRAISAGYLLQDERTPYRDLDLRLAVEWAGIEHDLPGWDALAQVSILGRPVRVPFVDVPAVYAFTHAFFFAHTLGTQPAQLGDWFHAPSLQRTLSELLISFSLEHDWDLVGELLLCWESARFPDTPISCAAWDGFIARQQTDGAFRGPENRGRRRTPVGEHEPVGDEADRKYFARHYHTTLVAIMALACRHAARVPRPVALTAHNSGIDPLPVDTDIEQSVGGAYRWACGILHDLEQGDIARPDAICRLLLISWMCEELLGFKSGRERTLGRISALLNAYARDDEWWRSVPAGLKLIAAALLSGNDKPVHALELFFDRVHQVLAAAPETDLDGDQGLLEKRVLLSALRLVPNPGLPRLEDVLANHAPIPVDDLSRADKFIDRLDACVGYGTKPVELSPESGWIVDFLTGLALHHLRVYDLSRASRVIRILSSLGPTGLSAARECSRYLLLQQQPSGSFGFLGMEAGELARSVPGFSAVADLQLPIMLDCLWALGESLCHPWRLYTAVAGVHVPVAEPGSVQGEDAPFGR